MKKSVFRENEFTAIWSGDVKARDMYVDFKDCFAADCCGERIFLEISCDSNYSANVNGKPVAFSACSDFPFSREYDKIDITEYCKENNQLFITVWHYGEDSQVYINADAFLAYKVIQGGKTLAESGRNTLSRINPFYKSGYRVPRIIGDRDFSAEYVAKQGNNEYFNSFRRFACRYMFVESEKDIEIDYIGLNEVEYPVKQKEFTLSDRFLQDIYDAGVRTLLACMHEHYEDCPWREQALYALDSRNQMLCGYYAFEGSEYQRYNLTLLAKSLDGGLLAICAPSGVKLPIPFFSLMFFVQTYEYVAHTGDRSILDEVGDTLKALYGTFSSRVNEDGLIPVFPSPCWNFYEWSDGSCDCVKDERGNVIENQYDLILNCAYVYAMRAYGQLSGVEIGVEKTARAIEKTFFSTEKGMYKLNTLTENYSQLGNAFALLIGLGDDKLAEKTVCGNGMIPITLSMNTFLYDALIARGENYRDFIVEDIKNKYGKMLSGETGTFWETELGAADFGGAGSLCHGWSAIPVYYLQCFFGEKPHFFAYFFEKK